MSTATLDRIRKETASLTDDEKTELLEHLLIDLQNGTTEISEAWIKEIEKRAADMGSGRDPGVPWEVVQKNMQQILNRS
ncbi:MAG: addiction module protein [Turneriella sp.]|mgnify:CR=1 FL=1